MEITEGSGVMVSKSKLVLAVSKAKNNSSLLVRYLTEIFFSDNVLAGSSCRGDKKRPGLRPDIVDAIKGMFLVVLKLGPKNELERSVNLVTKTRVHIKFFGHIDMILGRMI